MENPRFEDYLAIMETMKALMHMKYGSTEMLSVESLAAPQVGDDEVLVKVAAVSINPYDWHMMRGLPYLLRLQSGLFKPKNYGIGSDFAGTIVAVGKNVSTFVPGDEVFGGGKGTLADFTCVSPNKIVLKPTTLTLEESASISMAGETALQAVRDKGQVSAEQNVLIDGASGGVGTFAVQIAKSLGAKVTGVCSSRNVEMVRSIGADHVIDYTREDFTKSGLLYDVIIDAAGNHTLSEYQRALEPKGILVLVGGGDGGRFGFGVILGLLKLLVLSQIASQKMIQMLTRPNRQDLLVLKEMIEQGKIKPIIEKVYPFSAAIEAIQYVGSGHAKAKIVITL